VERRATQLNQLNRKKTLNSGGEPGVIMEEKEKSARLKSPKGDPAMGEDDSGRFSSGPGPVRIVPPGQKDSRAFLFDSDEDEGVGGLESEERVEEKRAPPATQV
jgi:hypothetical protein